MTESSSNDESVKPPTWFEFVGQELLKERLMVHIKAAVIGKRPLEHVLLSGPPGSGKTTLANLIPPALYFDCPRLTLNGVGLDRKQLIDRVCPPDFRGGVLIIDEIHAMAKKDQEFLLDLLGRGYLGNMHFGWITVIGATTERDAIITPLVDRFPLKPEFEPYTDEELGLIVQGMAERIDLDMTTETAQDLGRACGGIPSNAKQFVFAYRALLSTSGKIPEASQVLDLCQVDPDGLPQLHRRDDNRSSRPRPAGVLIKSPRDAERCAEVWMRWMGFEDARLTPEGPDSGIDVISRRAVAQVKAQTVPAPLEQIQRTYGIATAEQREHALFFSLGGYTPQALAWGRQHGVALFEFDLQGEPEAKSEAARRLLRDGLT